MQFMMTLILVVQLLAALTMIGLVLIQHGKGADMGASFGSGASGSLFGATGSANFLSRTTAVCATVFFACTLALAYLSTPDTRGAAAPGASVLDQPAAPGAAQIPGAPDAQSAPAAGQPASAPAAAGAAQIPASGN
jgi:preprotein translocase subunit SecG